MANDGVRVDVWLWAIRIYRSRNLSKTACSSGKVSINGVTAKPSRPVRVGDIVRTKAGGRERVLEVVELPSKRLGATLAAQAYIDSSPPPPERKPKLGPVAQRERGTGRPTKRDRRQIERLRGRDSPS